MTFLPFRRTSWHTNCTRILILAVFGYGQVKVPYLYQTVYSWSTKCTQFQPINWVTIKRADEHFKAHRTHSWTRKEAGSALNKHEFLFSR
ncbi:hypothetical protein SCLCIDRAFT_1208643 [Scleroderma citrinum Foug A]|uniref:Uncharacterized protein n=1 Tax=Scleroderma citrinum Foug A TaxID=1036808 RepID=A0A0C3AW84_9AGAM|nr:hypothetical protein SCLCIDRAFT_1208643 [Scleroderma citrinum Foug A]